MEPADANNQLFRASSDVIDENENVLVTAYPVKKGSVMLINKDHENARPVSISFVDQSTHRTRHFAETVERIAFGPAEYQWHEGVGTEYASPDGPASKSTVQSNASGTFELHPSWCTRQP